MKGEQVAKTTLARIVGRIGIDRRTAIRGPLAVVPFVVLGIGSGTPLPADDWPRFRGPDGRGIAASSVPSWWGDGRNVRWRTPLPGSGSSSPIVHGDRVYVSAWSRGQGNAPLVRHLLAIDRTDGRIAWQRDVAASGPDDAYQGYLTEHGYASSTPVTDGRTVVACFGKGGVVAWDRDGTELWQADVGQESSNRRWGSAASPVIVGDRVIVSAAEESQSLRAFDLRTGKPVWKAEASALELAYGTPVPVTLGDGTVELVRAVPEEVWGLDPSTGKTRWYATTALTGNVSPSVVVDGTTLYVFGGFRSAGSLALRAGGRGDVTKTHVLWTSRSSSYVATPVLHDGHLYWIDDRGQAHCISARDGAPVYRERVEGLAGGGGRPVYASPVVSGGRIYVVSRWSGTFVLPAEPRFKILAHNVFGDDDSDASATPAIADGDLFLRSGRFLTCIGE
jgi:outer membrane protein assembly factor BamB